MKFRKSQMLVLSGCNLYYCTTQKCFTGPELNKTRAHSVCGLQLYDSYCVFQHSSSAVNGQ